MKNTMLLSLLTALSLGACRSLQVGDYHSQQSIPERLPKLGLLVHDRSFIEAFDLEYIREALPGEYPDPWYAYQATDKALEDVFQLLGNELNDNLNKSSGATYGHARFKLIRYERRNPGWGWIIPSVCTLWTANLLGMPCSVLETNVEIQMEITDANDKMLLRYVAPGVGRATIALYHGYVGSEAIRKANLSALKNAMDQIKQKMAADVPTLTENLLAAGEVKTTGK